MATLSAPSGCRLRTFLAGLLVALLGASGARAQQLAGHFPVSGPPTLMVADPAARQLWVANSTDLTLTVIDWSYPLPLKSTVPIPTSMMGPVTLPTAKAMAVDPARHLVYVAYSDGSLRMIDEANPTNPEATYLLNAPPDTTGPVPVPAPDSTTGSSDTVGNPLVSLAVDPVLGLVYAVDQTASTVWVCPSGQAGTASHPVDMGVGAGPNAIAVNPVTGRAYVVNETNATVTVINGASAATVGTPIAVGPSPRGIAVDPKTNMIYVANRGDETVAGDETVTVIDGSGAAAPVVIPYASGTTSNFTGPVDLAVHPINGKIYACFDGGTRVSIIDPAASNSVTPVAVGSGPHGIAIDPVTGWVYVSNYGTGTLSCLDGVRAYAAGDAAGTVGLGTSAGYNGPGPVAVDPITGRVYVLERNAGGTDYAVMVVDGATNFTTDQSVSAAPALVRLDPVLGTFYVAHGSGTTVDTFDAAAPTQAPGSITGAKADAMAEDPATGLLFLGQEADGTVTIVDPSGAASLATVTVSAPVTVTDTTPRPDRIAVDPVTRRAFVANPESGTVAILEKGSTWTRTATATVGTRPCAVAVDPDQRQAYVANAGSNTLSVLRTGDPLAPVRTVTVGANPRAVVVDPRTHLVFVANRDDGTVSVYDPGTDAITATLTVGSQPTILAVDPDRRLVYAANQGDHTLSVIQSRSLNLTPKSVNLAATPTALAVDPLRGKVYVMMANTGVGQVQVVDVAAHVDSDTPAVTATVTTGDGASALAADPRTGVVAVINGPTHTVSLLKPNYRDLAPSITIAPLFTGASDQDHIPTVHTLTPDVQVKVTNAGSLPKPTDLRALGYDGTLGATATGGALGDNPRTFSATLGNSEFGLHTLYLVSGYGMDGSHTGMPSNPGSSPWVSQAAAAPYLLLPLPTTLALASDANPAAPGATVTLTATVTAATAGTANPGGTVRFYDLATTPPTLLGEKPLAAGSDPTVSTATCTASFTAAGTIAAAYEGDYEFMPAGTTLALAVSGGGSGKVTPTLTLSGLAGVKINRPFTLKATVTGAGPVPTGRVAVTASDGTQSVLLLDALGQGTVTMRYDGSLTFFDGLYQGDANYFQATSARTYLTVTKVATQVTLNGTESLTGGRLESLGATVSELTGDLPATEGTVVLLADGKEVSRGQVTINGEVVLDATQLPTGHPVVSLHYLGTANYLDSTSPGAPLATMPSLQVSLKQAVVINASPISDPGEDYRLRLDTPHVSAGTLILLEAKDLPIGTYARFTPAQVVAGSSGYADIDLVITATPSFVLVRQLGLRAGLGGGGLLACGLLALPWRNRRRRRRLLGFLIALAAVALGGLQGCVEPGGPIPDQNATPNGTYTIKVQATAPGLAPAITTVPLTVTSHVAP